MALEHCSNPRILETHGGFGRLFVECYKGIEGGVVLEKDARKAEYLARQRPTWAVYEADCLKALAGGIPVHLQPNFIDCDPYGSPFEVLAAFFESRQQFAPVIDIVVNDGLRQKLKLGGGWNVNCMADIVADYGSDLAGIYLDVAKEKLRRIVAGAGFKLVRWHGYYCGHAKQMTHYWARIEQAGTGNRGVG